MTWIDTAIAKYETISYEARTTAESLERMKKAGAVRDLLLQLDSVETIIEVWDLVEEITAPRGVKLRLADVESITRDASGEIIRVHFVDEKHAIDHSIEWNHELDVFEVVVAG
ncbi:hypothetical protein HD600_000201 [Microbacterium ginsengiterrae]|uniref:Uncharacterized protein n=1 Tax=Microbacterium ginsengiterrae TaxID=546115 RepID=A0A7W9FC21_9MICO|nr:hypothetical protein [Microbacterium ginsengiterrae]MBB5741704.1 hypothetical protein [Microbacterium ginsengiterrae]